VLAACSPSSDLPSRRGEHNADRDGAQAHRDGYPDALFLEVEGLDLRPAGALPRALAAWDAWADAHRDAAAGAVAPRGLHLGRVGGAEKSAVRARDARERHALRRRWELQAARLEQQGARVLCKLGAAQFAERSYAARVAAERRALPQPEAWGQRSPKLPEQAALKMLRPRAVSRDAAEARPRAKAGRALLSQEALRPVAR
jgi:hypothetical protein